MYIIPIDCSKPVPPKMLMCLRHWRMVPHKLQIQIWKHYVPGQEDRKDPTPEYILVQRAACYAVAIEEGKGAWEQVPEIGTPAYLALQWASMEPS